MGPELSEKNNNLTVIKNNRLEGKFFKGLIFDFLQKNSFENKFVLFFGFNPGFGSGYDKLLYSWC